MEDWAVAYTAVLLNDESGFLKLTALLSSYPDPGVFDPGVVASATISSLATTAL